MLEYFLTNFSYQSMDAFLKVQLVTRSLQLIVYCLSKFHLSGYDFTMILKIWHQINRELTRQINACEFDSKRKVVI